MAKPREQKAHIVKKACVWEERKIKLLTFAETADNAVTSSPLPMASQPEERTQACV